MRRATRGVGGGARSVYGGTGCAVGRRVHGTCAGGKAHRKHVAHVRDAGRVEAQRLVERLRRLPSHQTEAREEGKHGGAVAAHAACTEEPAVGCTAHAGGGGPR